MPTRSPLAPPEYGVWDFHRTKFQNLISGGGYLYADLEESCTAGELYTNLQENPIFHARGKLGSLDILI